MYTIDFSSDAVKFLQKCEVETRNRLEKAIRRLEIRPYAHITALAYPPHMYKFRVGDYRVILQIDNHVLHILVVEIAPRKNIYDKAR